MLCPRCGKDVPKEELWNDTHKCLEQLKLYKKIRRTWVVPPVTKIKKSNKLYKRAKIKKETDTLIKEETNCSEDY